MLVCPISRKFKMYIKTQFPFFCSGGTGPLFRTNLLLGYAQSGYERCGINNRPNVSWDPKPVRSATDQLPNRSTERRNVCKQWNKNNGNNWTQSFQPGHTNERKTMIRMDDQFSKIYFWNMGLVNMYVDVWGVFVSHYIFIFWMRLLD